MDMEVLDILKVDDKKFSVTVNMYFGVRWNESRMEGETEKNGCFESTDSQIYRYTDFLLCSYR